MCFVLVFIIMSVPFCLVDTCWEKVDLLDHLYVMFSCVLSPSHMVSWVRCGIWLYQVLIFSFFLTFYLNVIPSILNPRCQLNTIDNQYAKFEQPLSRNLRENCVTRSKTDFKII